MKDRIKTIINELRTVVKDECLSISHDTLFTESLSVYRGEMTGKNKRGDYNSKPKPATDKQIAYVQQLADKKNINITITGKETGFEISKLIKELSK